MVPQQARVIYSFFDFNFTMKQHLRIKVFYGTSENAEKIQTWIAVSAYVLVAIVKKSLGLTHSLYTILQILSTAFLRKSPFHRPFHAKLLQMIFIHPITNWNYSTFNRTPVVRNRKILEDLYFNLNATMPWPGRLMVTHVMRIEKKYRTPPTGICVEISPEEIYEGIYEMSS